MRTVPSGWKNPLQAKCGCYPPRNHHGTPWDVRDRTREGELAVCDHGAVWEVYDPSTPVTTFMVYSWRRVHGLRAWWARRQAR